MNRASSESDVLTQSWPDCLVPECEVSKKDAAACKRRVGVVTTTVKHTACVDWAPRFVLEVTAPNYAFIDPQTRLLMAAVSAHANACRYCYGAMRALLQINGFDDATITELQGDIQIGRYDNKVKQTLDFTRALVNAEPSAKDYLPVLKDVGYDDQEIAELVYWAALSAASHRINTPLALPPDNIENLARAPWMKIVRPIFARVMGAKHMPKAPSDPLSPEQCAGPFADIVAVLERSPGAGELRAIIDEAMASQITTPTQRGYIHAIIGRTMGARYVEAEARRLLNNSGVNDETISSILDHLQHPSLSETDRQIINYARDSVRYQVPTIQNSLRDLAPGKSPNVIIDIVCQVALANTIARMSMLVD